LGAAWDFYAGDGPAAAMTGRLGPALAACALLAAPILWFRDRRRFWEHAALLGLTVASLAIMLYGKHANSFFGLTYQIALWFALLLAMASTSLPTWARPALGSLFLAGAVWQLLQPHTAIVFNLTPGAGKGLHNQAVLSALHADATTQGLPGKPTVFVTVAGSLNATTLQWMARRDGVSLEFHDLHLSADFEAYRQRFRSTHYIVVPIQGAPGVFEWLPSATIQDQVRQELSGDGFTLVRPPDDAAPYYVFSNDALIPRESPHPE
jgi:hypothetical protein